MKKVFLMALAVMFCGTVGDAKVNGTDDNAKTPDGVEAVDLGLSVKWANMNVGAKKSTGYGTYYAWGETKEKEVYNWSTYKWCNGSKDTLIKYCNISSCGIKDNKEVLDPEDDVAHVKWGGSWKMPSYSQMSELKGKCSSEWTTVNGVEGRKFTGPNGYSIFLPAAGERAYSRHDEQGSYAYYWSTSLRSYYPERAYRLNFNSFFVDFGGTYETYGLGYRFIGYSVRPVCQ